MSQKRQRQIQHRQKEWSTQTVIDQLDRKVQAALGDGIKDPDSPVLDETVGDLLDMLMKADYGVRVQLPGQTSLLADDAES